MPFKDELRKLLNDNDLNVQYAKDLLDQLGINHGNRERFDIQFPHCLNFGETEKIEYRWLASTSMAGNSNQEKGKQAILVLEALVELKHCIQVSDITPKLKESFLKLEPSGVVSFKNMASSIFPNEANHYNNTVNASLNSAGKTYPAKWNDISTKELLEKFGAFNPVMKIVGLSNTATTNNNNSEIASIMTAPKDTNKKIEELKSLAQQLKISCDNDGFAMKFYNPEAKPSIFAIPLKNQVKFNWENSSNLEEKETFNQCEYVLKALKALILDAGKPTSDWSENFKKLNPDGLVMLYNAVLGNFINKLSSLESLINYSEDKPQIPETWKNISTEKLLRGCIESEIIDALYNNTKSTQPTEIEVKTEKNLLGEKVKLTNGTEYEVKKIIDLVFKPNSEKQLLKIFSNIADKNVLNLIEKEIALKLAFVGDNDIDKYDEVHNIVRKLPNEIIEAFNNYTSDDFTLDEMYQEQLKITGDANAYF